jgi:ethanolamine utilization protein EutP (predicted NTPase)
MEFAKKCGTSVNYLRKAISTKQVFSPKLVVLFEKHSKGMVTRKDFHPDDYKSIWPELK